MLIDLHAHSTNTKDCFFDPHDVIQNGKKAGLDGCAFADTDFHEDFEELKSFGKENGMAVLFGREVCTSGGHLVAFAPDYRSLSSLPWESGSEPPKPEDVIEHINKIGGAVVAAHPYCREHEHNMGDGIFSLKGLAAIESENAARGKMTNDLAAEAAFSMQLPCCGGSDAKQTIEQIGAAATLFKKDVASETELIAELKAAAFWPVKVGDFPPKEERGYGRRDERGGRGRDRRGGSDHQYGGMRSDSAQGRPFDSTQGRPFNRAQGGRGGDRRDGQRGGRGGGFRGGNRDRGGNR
ncbi:MAG: PHP domain-containing protein [Deltaproteobacteria bacterium]|nr:PHP domain-containing protein [Deltaproteobacteria bacterium]